MSKRFSKSLALRALDVMAAHVCKQQRFDLSNGTAQLSQIGTTESECARIARAVQYGRMRAFEDFAESIKDGSICDLKQE